MATSPYTRVTVDSYNPSAPPDDGTTVIANQITWAGIKSKLADPVKVAVEAMDQSIAEAFAENPMNLVSLKMDPGTSVQCPFRLQSGTNLTAPVAGGFEYDGKALYTSYAASQRGVAPSVQFTLNTSDVSLTNDTSAQSPFASAADTMTVAATTTYFMDGLIYLTTGTTDHLINLSFDAGTCTFTSILYDVVANSLSDYEYADNISLLTVDTASDTTIVNAGTNAEAIIRLKGVLRINGAGTLIPRIRFQTAPGGTNLCKTNSFMRLYPVGSNTVASVGNWA